MKKNLLFLLGFLPFIFNSCEKDYLFVDDVDLKSQGVKGSLKGNYEIFSDKGFDLYYLEGVDTLRVGNFDAKPYCAFFGGDMSVIVGIDTLGKNKTYFVKNENGLFSKPELIGEVESLKE